MKLPFYIFITTASITLLFSSCYYDKEDLLYGQNFCDTSVVKYSVQITNILNTSCLSCHNGSAAAGGGIPLGDYASVKAAADDGSLIASVTRSVNTMPKGSARLSDCKIETIRIWIRNGAPNN